MQCMAIQTAHARRDVFRRFLTQTPQTQHSTINLWDSHIPATSCIWQAQDVEGGSTNDPMLPVDRLGFRRSLGDITEADTDKTIAVETWQLLLQLVEGWSPGSAG